MFPSEVIRRLDEVIPKLNPILANGLAVEHMKHVESYVDSIFRAAAAGFPPGLLYLGCRRCTPKEEYDILTRKKGSSCTFDVARSDVYMMEYRFSYNSEMLPPKYLLLPFVSDAGVIYVSGSRFVISPILSDRVISIGINNVFVRLLKARLTFNSMPYSFLKDGERETIQVLWSKIYNETSKAPIIPTVKANCTLVHYLLCKFGYTQMFHMFAGYTPVIGYHDTVNYEKYPKSDWVICSSSCYAAPGKPRGQARVIYEKSAICIAVPKEHYTAMMKNLIAGFFYIVDHFPTYVKLEYIEHHDLWKYLLGHIIWSGNINRGKLISDVSDHISSLDEYVDAIVINKLRNIGHDVKDIYEIFGLILNNFNDWLLSSDDRINTMYDKELSILYYVFFEISSAIFKLYFKLKAAQKKDLNINKIINIMNINLKLGLIFKIAKDHGEVSTTSTSGDNKALKTTLILVPQSGSTKSKQKKKERLSLTDPSKRLNASIAEVGGYAALPKAEPTGRSRLNLHVNIDPSGLIVRNPKYVDLIDSVQSMIRR